MPAEHLHGLAQDLAALDVPLTITLTLSNTNSNSEIAMV